MSEQRRNQRDKTEANQLDVDELKDFTNFQISDDDELKSIQILNDDCLEIIFRALPLVDLYRVQRVCKRWRSVSMSICPRITKLYMSRSFWGVSTRFNIHIDLSVLDKVLCICGRNLQYIGLSNDEDRYPQRKRRIHVESDKKVWILIHNRCPGITSIDFGQSRSTVALKFVSNHFKNLTYFKMHKFTLPGKTPPIHEIHISQLFANNVNLQRVELFDARITTECLMTLNSTNIQELTLQDCMINNNEHLIQALKELTRLKCLTVSRCICLQDNWINAVLEAITFMSDRLIYLDFFLYNPAYEIIDTIYLRKLKKLEYLSIAGDTVIDDDALTNIGECCINLKKLHIYKTESITAMGFEKLTELKELESLVLTELAILRNDVLRSMINLVNLEVHRCPYFENQGFMDLVRNSQNIRTLKIFNCKMVRECQLIEEVKWCSKDNIELIIDSSEVRDYYLKCIYKLIKSNGKVTKIVKKLCYDCFIRKNEENIDCKLCCDIFE
ncbi:F-box/LRR-repeat protein 7-like [Phymastichus coffea]|uniref:F-box/LRR-repeat protein 7-like n=1 Tax=Phymastichus coffea TaxID=108790 RepID=UPI00273CBFA4|nr:F-box/LRR-repeat protein 7-like [Phymastichus coffea]